MPYVTNFKIGNELIDIKDPEVETQLNEFKTEIENELESFLPTVSRSPQEVLLSRKFRLIMSRSGTYCLPQSICSDGNFVYICFIQDAVPSNDVVALRKYDLSGNLLAENMNVRGHGNSIEYIDGYLYVSTSGLYNGGSSLTGTKTLYKIAANFTSATTAELITINNVGSFTAFSYDKVNNIYVYRGSDTVWYGNSINGNFTQITLDKPYFLNFGESANQDILARNDLVYCCYYKPNMIVAYDYTGKVKQTYALEPYISGLFYGGEFEGFYPISEGYGGVQCFLNLVRMGGNKDMMINVSLGNIFSGYAPSVQYSGSRTTITNQYIFNVDPVSSDNNPDGSSIKPFKTAQEAIEASYSPYVADCTIRLSQSGDNGYVYARGLSKPIRIDGGSAIPSNTTTYSLESLYIEKCPIVDIRYLSVNGNFLVNDSLCHFNNVANFKISGCFFDFTKGKTLHIEYSVGYFNQINGIGTSGTCIRVAQGSVVTAYSTAPTHDGAISIESRSVYNTGSSFVDNQYYLSSGAHVFPSMRKLGEFSNVGTLAKTYNIDHSWCIGTDDLSNYINTIFVEVNLAPPGCGTRKAFVSFRLFDGTTNMTVNCSGSFAKSNGSGTVDYTFTVVFDDDAFTMTLSECYYNDNGSVSAISNAGSVQVYGVQA